MIEKNLDEITEEDLQALIDNSVLERKRLEFKQSLPGGSDSEKKEFLADVSSFANASGGDLIYGMVEDRKTGYPKSLNGLVLENVDKEITRMENIIRDGIEPRIIGITTKPISLTNQTIVIIIRVPKSWISPHRVSFKGHDKFYSRSTNGKYPLDVSELRIAFNLSEMVMERIRKFREDRLSKILANELPLTFSENARIVLHLIPTISFNPAQQYDINIAFKDIAKLEPINSGDWGYRYNIDGIFTYSMLRDNVIFSYTQLYKNGIIEAVEGLMLKPHQEQLLIPSQSYEKKLIKSVSNYLTVLKKLGVETPIFIFLALLGVEGYSMASASHFPPTRVNTIDRDILILPEAIIENYNISIERVLQPSFDSIWNACGYPKSLNYNENGEWIGQK
ncbi:MAG: helix-turn-helix domain-containing protein [Promethearchaeota archaeon]